MPNTRPHQRARKVPPLIKIELTETDPESGAPVQVTRFRRGALMTESRKYTSFGQWVKDLCEPTRNILERMCEQIRDRLEESGLPSDRTPQWIRKLGSEWEPCDKISGPPALDIAYALWTSRITKLTEPLTIERAAGDLLWDLTQLLERDGIDEHLWHIAQLMQSYAAFKMVGPINSAAAAGLAAEKARASGPAKRQQRAIQIRAVVWGCAQAAWSERPILRDDASNTAAQISSEVNAILRAERLLPSGKNSLSVKTIGDHIRASIRGQII